MQLLQNRMYLAEVLRRRIAERIDNEAERLFAGKVAKDAIRFRLLTDEKLNYEIQKTLELAVADEAEPLSHNMQRSLFEDVFAGEFNTLERDFALYLDESQAIHWWHRMAARREYAIQGWRRRRVYPDFIACMNGDGRLLIMETKGDQLAGNEDTAYKQALLQRLTAVYRDALDRGELRTADPPMTFKMLFENSWKEELNHLVDA